MQYGSNHLSRSILREVVLALRGCSLEHDWERPAMTKPLVDDKQFRKACGKFSTGVAVATVRQNEHTAVGLTVSSFTSVSLDPPLVLFCVHRQSRVLPEFRKCQRFGINVLSADQLELSTRFASRETQNFHCLNDQPGSVCVPILPGALAVLECKLENVISCGDHDILVGEVVALSVKDGDPLSRY